MYAKYVQFANILCLGGTHQPLTMKPDTKQYLPQINISDTSAKTA